MMKPVAMTIKSMLQLLRLLRPDGVGPLISQRDSIILWAQLLLETVSRIQLGRPILV